MLRRRVTTSSIRPRTRNSELGCVWPGSVSRESRTVQPSRLQTLFMIGKPSELLVRTILSPSPATAGPASDAKKTARTRQTSHLALMTTQTLPPIGSRHSSVPRLRPATRSVLRPQGSRAAPCAPSDEQPGQRESPDLGDTDGESKVLGGN